MTLAYRLHLGNMCVQQGLVILGQPFTALSHIHALQMIHRDLKPSNIIFTQDHSLIIIDFGHASVSQTAEFLGRYGTQGYAAPEISSGNCYTQAADIYSAGVVARDIAVASWSEWSLVEVRVRSNISRCTCSPRLRPSAQAMTKLFTDVSAQFRV